MVYVPIGNQKCNKLTFHPLKYLSVWGWGGGMKHSGRSGSSVKLLTLKDTDLKLCLNWWESAVYRVRTSDLRSSTGLGHNNLRQQQDLGDFLSLQSSGPHLASALWSGSSRRKQSKPNHPSTARLVWAEPLPPGWLAGLGLQARGSLGQAAPRD